MVNQPATVPNPCTAHIAPLVHPHSHVGVDLQLKPARLLGLLCLLCLLLSRLQRRRLRIPLVPRAAALAALLRRRRLLRIAALWRPGWLGLRSLGWRRLAWRRLAWRRLAAWTVFILIVWQVGILGNGAEVASGKV